MSDLQGVWTQYGLDRMAAAQAGGNPITITYAAVGTGNGVVPIVSPSQTELMDEVWHGPVNNVQVNPEDSTDVIVEAVIPNNIGGFWIREWGLFDEENKLIVVGPHDEMHKPLISSGQSAEFLEVFHLPVSEEANISITVASQALATLAAVERMIDAHDEDENAHESLIGDIDDIGDALAVHAGQTTAHGATPSATPSRLILRDPAGRAKVAAPAADDDIARKVEVDAVLDEVGDVGDALATHAAQTTVHGATPSATPSKIVLRDQAGRAKVAAPAADDDIARLLDIKQFTRPEILEFRTFYRQAPPQGWIVLNGQQLVNVSTAYPDLLAALQLTENNWLCKTDAEWQAQSDDWDGIGGVGFFALNLANNTVRMPDFRGLFPEFAGFDGLVPAGAKKDAIRNITGKARFRSGESYSLISHEQMDGAFYLEAAQGATYTTVYLNGSSTIYNGFVFNASRVVPTGPVNRPRSVGILPAIYVGGA